MTMAEETTLQRIMRLSECQPSECHCARCQQMCRVPCIGTPEDIERLVDAGYADRLTPTEWLVGCYVGLTDGPISMIQPETVNGWCTFYHNGLCELHDRGLKPTEGRLTRHDDVETHGKVPLENNVTFLVAKEWISDKNFLTILRLCEKIKIHIEKERIRWEGSAPPGTNIK